MAELEPASSRTEALLHAQLEEQKETNRLLRKVLDRMPVWPTMGDFQRIVREGSD